MKISFVAVVLLWLLFVFIGGLATGCAKEYSYERRPADSVTVFTPAVPLPSCRLCLAPGLPDSSWRFTIDGTTYCGHAEKTVITLERTSFTFFGPSACSGDSGFVASVYLENAALTTDKTNLPVRLVCYYYDQVGPSYVYMSSPGQPLQMIIDRYDYRTGIASGTFQGYVSASNGQKKEVKDGQFRIHL